MPQCENKAFCMAIGWDTLWSQLVSRLWVGRVPPVAWELPSCSTCALPFPPKIADDIMSIIPWHHYLIHDPGPIKGRWGMCRGSLVFRCWREGLVLSPGYWCIPHWDKDCCINIEGSDLFLFTIAWLAKHLAGSHFISYYWVAWLKQDRLPPHADQEYPTARTTENL